MFVIKIPNSMKSRSSFSCPLPITTAATKFALFTILLAIAPQFTTAATTSISPSALLDETLPVHKLRAAYELVQSKSWRLIESQYATSSNKPTDSVKTKIVKELFAFHNNYIATQLAVYERENKEQSRSVFPEFNHFYEWNYVQGHINATNSLFDVFRQYLEAHHNEVDALGARDFAETVLYDKKWPIEKSFNDIHHIMIGQGLYYKMALVHIEFDRKREEMTRKQ